MVITPRDVDGALATRIRENRNSSVRMSDIDGAGLENHSLPAPMVPNIAAKEDVSNFNPEAEISGVDWANLEPFEGDDSWCADF